MQILFGVLHIKAIVQPIGHWHRTSIAKIAKFRKKTIPFDKTQWIEHLNVTMVMTTMNMRITMIMEMVTTFVVANGMTFANTAFELSAS